MVKLVVEVLLHLLTGVILSWAAISYGLSRSEPNTAVAQAAKVGMTASLAQASPVEAQSAAPLAVTDLLNESWSAYRQRFIQSDGRVIDRENQDRTVSEGQAYAMLRAVFVDDRETFALTLNWAEGNLQRRRLEAPAQESPTNQPSQQTSPTPNQPAKSAIKSAAKPSIKQPTKLPITQPLLSISPSASSQPAIGERLDSLWAWKWGQRDPNNWGILDQNFASDADLDAATALILASRRWNRPDYLELARTKLNDLWDHSTVTESTVTEPRSRRPKRYFLPGPIASFQPAADQVYLNPSYLAPYAFRLFAQVDPSHDWLSLVESSYQVLEDSSQLSRVKLPSDWVVLNLKTGQFSSPTAASPLRSTYSFDAFRVWWRVALDAAWFDEPKAKAYLSQHLPYLQQLWRSDQRIPARINLRGAATASYDATSQYAMLYSALLISDPAMADQILKQKLLPTYRDGIWDNDRAYYTQNLVWLGLYPAADNQLQLQIR